MFLKPLIRFLYPIDLFLNPLSLFSHTIYLRIQFLREGVPLHIGDHVKYRPKVPSSARPAAPPLAGRLRR